MPLIVNGEEVNKISGPVSMYILTPKKSELFPNLPLYMLFGDLHGSTVNMCQEDESKGVYKIYDIEFLGLLSKLGSVEEPIDFYVEGGDFHNFRDDAPKIDEYPMERLWDLYKECYRNPTNPLVPLAQYPHTTDCSKIANIRWHSGDARFFDGHS